MISIPAILLTAAWVVLVGLILALFGRTAGGAWSIAGSVARGVTEWAGARGRAATRSSASQAPTPPQAPSRTARELPTSAAETEDFGDRPVDLR